MILKSHDHRVAVVCFLFALCTWEKKKISNSWGVKELLFAPGRRLLSLYTAGFESQQLLKEQCIFTLCLNFTWEGRLFWGASGSLKPLSADILGNCQSLVCLAEHKDRRDERHGIICDPAVFHMAACSEWFVKTLRGGRSWETFLDIAHFGHMLHEESAFHLQVQFLSVQSPALKQLLPSARAPTCPGQNWLLTTHPRQVRPFPFSCQRTKYMYIFYYLRLCTFFLKVPENFLFVVSEKSEVKKSCSEKGKDFGRCALKIVAQSAWRSHRL